MKKALLYIVGALVLLVVIGFAAAALLLDAEALSATLADQASAAIGPSPRILGQSASTSSAAKSLRSGSSDFA